MARITVAYFLDEHLPGLDLALPGTIAVTAGPIGGTGWAAVLPVCESVAAVVAQTVVGGERRVVLSGDCITALGTVAGLQRAGLDPGIVWLDAHGDVQTMETTTSGFLGGMPLRILVGYRPDLIAVPLGLRAVAEERVVLVDARDLDPPEVDYLRQAQIVRTTVDDLSATGLPEGPLYVHIDLDVVDPVDLAGLRYPAPHGPSLTAVCRAVGALLGTGNVVAVGIACTWYPDVTVEDRVRAELESMLTAFAESTNSSQPGVPADLPRHAAGPGG